MSEKELNNDELMEDGIIELIDDDGNKVKFECLSTFDHKDHFYAALLPVDAVEGMEDGEVLIMRIDDDPETEITSFSPVESEEELDEAWDVFIKLYEEEDECDCEDCEEGCDCGCEDESCDCGCEDCDHE